jgi:hypothetical protein
MGERATELGNKKKVEKMLHTIKRNQAKQDLQSIG